MRRDNRWNWEAVGIWDKVDTDPRVAALIKRIARTNYYVSADDELLIELCLLQDQVLLEQADEE